MSYRGDFAAGQVVWFRISTYGNGNAPITLAGTPQVVVYRDGGAAETTTGVILMVDFDARTGLHLVAVNTAADASFFEEGSDFDVVLAAGTVDSIAVAGTVLASFSIANRADSRATGEVAGVPEATSTPQARTGWLFKLARNRTNVTGSGIAVRNDADNADDATATHTESAGTYTRDKFR